MGCLRSPYWASRSFGSRLLSIRPIRMKFYTIGGATASIPTMSRAIGVKD